MESTVLKHLPRPLCGDGAGAPGGALRHSAGLGEHGDAGDNQRTSIEGPASFPRRSHPEEPRHGGFHRHGGQGDARRGIIPRFSMLSIRSYQSLPKHETKWRVADEHLDHASEHVIHRLPKDTGAFHCDHRAVLFHEPVGQGEKRRIGRGKLASLFADLTVGVHAAQTRRERVLVDIDATNRRDVLPASLHPPAVWQTHDR